MKRTVKFALGAGAALALGLAAAAASAHPQGYGPGWGQGHWGGMGYGGGPGAMGPGMGPRFGGYGNPGAAVEDRLAARKTALKITAAQESAWQEYAAQVKQSAEARQATMTTMRENVPATAPERQARRNEIMKQHLAQSEATSAAFKKLYDVLTPEQRAIADRGPIAAGPGYRGPGGRFR